MKVVLFTVAFLLLTPATCLAEEREVAIAILLSAPDLSRSTAVGYAKVIVKEARRHGIDPMTIVSLVAHESQFHASAIGNAKNGDPMIGLGQIRAKNNAACAKDLESVDCKSHISSLMVGVNNLKLVASEIALVRKFCRKYKDAKDVLLVEWLFQYGGFGSSKGHCGWKKAKGEMRRLDSKESSRLPVPKSVMDISKYRKCLRKEVFRGTKPSTRPGWRFSCWKLFGR